MTSFCLRLFIYLFLFSALRGTAQHVPPGSSKSMEMVFVTSDNWMNSNSYDSAYATLSSAYVHRFNECTLTDRYYIHALISEILYYNALFVQGMVESENALAIARSLQNDSLMANTENMLGLIHLNLDEYDLALSYFRSALHHFPQHQPNRFLAYRYHVLANMGECFIKMNVPDSALFYSEQSKIEAKALGRVRGVAFALLNEAQVQWMRHDKNRAQHALDAARLEVDSTNHRDVVQLLIAEEMRLAYAGADRAKVQELCRLGLSELDSDWNTDYARLEFLQTASDILIQMGDPSAAAGLLHRQVKLVEVIRSKQERNQATVLRDYVHKSESLLYASQLEESLVNEIFWRRLTMVIAAVLLLVCITAGFFYLALIRRKRNLQALQLEAQMQRELKRVEQESNQKSLDAIALERNRIASDLHDDLGASLSGINIYSSLAMKPGLDEATRLKWIEKIKALSSQMNENMSDIVWSIYAVHDNWPSVVLRMQAYAAEVLSLQNITVRFDVDKNLLLIAASLELRHHLMMCFKEAVINVCKYSEAKHVNIALHLTDKQLQLLIQDDGVGFRRDAEQAGNGLKNMERRMAKLHGQLTVHSENQKGTKIVFVVPVQQDSNTAV